MKTTRERQIKAREERMITEEMVRGWKEFEAKLRGTWWLRLDDIRAAWEDGFASGALYEMDRQEGGR